MSFSVEVGQLGGESARISAIHEGLRDLSNELAHVRDAAADTPAAGAHARAAGTWVGGLGRYAGAADAIAQALLLAVACYDSADHFPGG